MLRFSCVLALLAVAVAGPETEIYSYEPKPYSFSYDSTDDGGHHSHSQSSDGVKVTGQYELVDVDGRNRVVDYVADEMGFRAAIRTNEPGTDNASPADVQMEANPMQVQEPMTRHAPVAMRAVEQVRPLPYQVAVPRPATRIVEAAPIHYTRSHMMPVSATGYAMAPRSQLVYRH